MARSDLILDTCALLWLASGDSRLSARAREAIDDAVMVHVSAISGFEIGLKYARGQLGLPVAAGEWLARVVAHHGLSVLPLDLRTCIRATELLAVHRDPVDRLIIAQALERDAAVVTADAQFAAYGVEVVS
jgi:PIN domain nuclease of toxin-antitoxin system